jgi:1-phosphofructokinase
MFYTLYLNPTIDKTVYFHKFLLGKTNRPYRALEDGAGKAINVAVVLKELCADVSCVGVLPSGGGQIIQNRLEAHGIPYEFLENDGRPRVNIKIFDDQTKTITEINEKGAVVSKRELALLENKLITETKNQDCVFLTGSLPDGCEASFYADMIEKLNKKGVRCILDASGEPLRLGIEAKPYFIKPNKEEICALFKLPDPDVLEIAKAAKKLSDEGIRYVMVSLGGDGAMIAGDGEVLFAGALTTEVKSTVGAGDSMVAAAALQLDKNMEAVLKSGVAAASASVMQEGTKLMEYKDYDRLLGEVQVDRLL